MTRAEIEKDYSVVDGVIKSPGKFEGEPVFAPYFWEALLNGEADSDEGGIAKFSITPEDLKEFPELGGDGTVIVEEDENGFVYVWVRWTK